MIRYTLQCPDGHRFESWFQNAAAYESLAAGGHLSCPDCGAVKVEKSLMAPPVRAARKAAAAPSDTPETELARLKARIEAESDYVGTGFVKEARAIHDGEAPRRPIHGEARPAEAIRLIEDGIPVAPLPFIPTRKTN
ncbi:DUF1178 family protein [Maritimibacter fusiformis]|uniref:DUF1178 family protein n=1 Tax=Maritimibacter fusiformis TaxID=2603819 RepID=A0A5D0RL45_9RHOB|nr:DUF1178 family protein [Maritimibacter fusiformis]TYB81244.1 DUF1178 family protein [Maritimibacter fusiformis]